MIREHRSVRCLWAFSALGLLALPGAGEDPSAAVPVRDINATRPDEGSDPSSFLDFAGAVFFAADDGLHGRELWRTDGTPEGTRLVRDICSGPCGAEPEAFVPVGDQMFFAAFDETVGRELWVTDGTTAGTRLVRDICPGECSPPYLGSTLHIGALTALDTELLIFRADDGVHGNEPWKSDGTFDGTVMLGDLCPGECRSAPRDLLSVGDEVFFSAEVDTAGAVRWSLWKTDGTPAGTVEVAVAVSPHRLTAFADKLYFSGSDATHGGELWTSDGTAAGTYMLKDIQPGYGSSLPRSLAVVTDDLLLFFAEEAEDHCGLWRTDGTENGTIRVKELPFCFIPTMASAGDQLFFGVYHRGLWASDGTEGGTRRWTTADPSQLTAVGDLVFFSRNGLQVLDSRTGHLWPVMSFPAAIDGLAAAANRLYFAAPAAGHGREPWTSDGTPEGTERVADIRAVSSSDPRGLYALGDVVYFAADDGTTGRELWRSDGTTAGTWQVVDLVAGPESSNPHEIIRRDETLFVSVLGDWEDPLAALWKSEGTADTTVRLGTFPSFDGQEEPVAQYLTVLGDEIFFSASSQDGVELWKSDGTVDGTVQVLDILPDWEWDSVCFCHIPRSSYPAELTALAGTLYFTARSEGKGLRLWRSDGTAAGTAIVEGDGFNVRELTVVGGRIYLVASEASSGVELWRTARDPAVIRRVADIVPGESSSSPRELTALGSRLFFITDLGSGSDQLWTSAGTTASTRPVSDLSAHGPVSEVTRLTAAGGRLFFTAYSAETGQELWMSDGTANGTVMLRDIHPGPGSSHPQSLSAINGRLLFAADDGTRGLEPWTSDGTREGTVPLPEITEGSTSSAPASFTAAGSKIFFAASDTGMGRELWAFDRGALGGLCQPGSERLCLRAGRFAVEVDWRDFDGNAGAARVVSVHSADSGLFWFFTADNWEMLVKVLDGCALNGHFWVFAAATTNVEYRLRVRDLAAGAAAEYFNPLGHSAAAITDTRAFTTCP